MRKSGKERCNNTTKNLQEEDSSPCFWGKSCVNSDAVILKVEWVASFLASSLKGNQSRRWPLCLLILCLGLICE